MTVKQAAERLGVSPSLVYALARAGKITHERHGLAGGRIVIREEALEAYRAGCVRAGRGPSPGPALTHISVR